MALLFAAARDVARMDRELRVGEWFPRGGMQLHGRKVAVLGLGGIGRTFAQMAAGLATLSRTWTELYAMQRS
jgi:D-3-phosphoglycerate dehydrogenase